MMRNEPLMPTIGGPKAPDDVLDAPRPRQARGACAALADALTERGLHITYLRADLLLALKPVAVCGRASTQLRTTGLKQLIACRPQPADDGRLWFWWVWALAHDHLPVELQPLCPATQVATAATRVTAVLAVRDDSSSIGL